MPIIELKTDIEADPEIVFDLARSIDLHIKSTAQTNERAVAGRTSGLIELGEEVTWEATHFGFRQQLTVKITEFDRPHHFRDTMLRGAFRSFNHVHSFQADESGTLMIDRFEYISPLGPLGRLADILFLKRYMTRMLSIRNELIKSVAESGKAKEILD